MSGIAAVSGSMSSVAAASFVAPQAAAAGPAGAAAAGGASGSDGVAGANSSSLANFAATLAGLDPSALGGAAGSTSVQTSALINSAQPNANIQNMAALMLSLLLSKSDDSKESKDDAWKMLAGMALLGMMASQNQGASMMQTTSVVTAAYGAGAGAAAAGAAGSAVNIQG